MSPSTRGVLLVVFSAASWGCWSLCFRPTGLPGTVTAPIMLAALAVLTLPLYRFDPPPRWSRRAVMLLLGYAVCDAVNAGTFFSAMTVGTVAVAVLTHSLGPVIVAVVAPLAGERPSPVAAPAALVALGGIALVLEPWREASGDVWLGALLGTASAIGYAGNVLLSKKLADDIGTARTLGMHAAISALLLLPLGGAAFLDIETGDLLPLAIAVTVPGVLAGLAFLRALSDIGPARAAVLALLEPLVACVVGWVAFGEHLGPLAIVGGALVIGAAAWVALPRAVAPAPA